MRQFVLVAVAQRSRLVKDHTRKHLQKELTLVIEELLHFP